MQVSVWINKDNENFYYQLPQKEKGKLVNYLLREYREKLVREGILVEQDSH